MQQSPIWQLQILTWVHIRFPVSMIPPMNCGYGFMVRMDRYPRPKATPGRQLLLNYCHAHGVELPKGTRMAMEHLWTFRSPIRTSTRYQTRTRSLRRSGLSAVNLT